MGSQVTREDAEEFTQSLSQIFAGSWRQIAWAKEQGIPKALGLTTEQWVKEKLGGYVRLSLEERQEAVSFGTANGYSLREVSEIIGVSKSTVARTVPNGTKRAERLERNRLIKEYNAPLPVAQRKYAVIYADPPWSFDVWSGEGKDRAAENHYPTMEQDEIESLKVGDLAADDCSLFLWAVLPQLPEALRVIKAWGFAYKTCAFVWIKQTKDKDKLATGMGYWTRANAELCLLATKGAPVRLNADVHQVILSPRLKHSQKPDEAAQRIERLVPGPYIELFSRTKRDGWDTWGNEA